MSIIEKSQGLDNVLRFIETPWAKKNDFKALLISHQNIQYLFKGKYKTYQKLNDASFEKDDQKSYIVVTYTIENKTLGVFTDIVDCIIIKD